MEAVKNQNNTKNDETTKTRTLGFGCAERRPLKNASQKTHELNRTQRFMCFLTGVLQRSRLAEQAGSRSPDQDTKKYGTRCFLSSSCLRASSCLRGYRVFRRQFFVTLT